MLEGTNERIAIVGLGYVGLPVALAMARRFPETIGFDINRKRVDALRRGVDWSGETDPEALARSSLRLTSDTETLREATFFIVAVPTPIDSNHCPDLGPLLCASETLGRVLRRGSVVVYESTVYPGVTEEICGPVLAKASGLRQGVDFKLGYSPERINPGDREHTFERIVKVVSGEDAETLERVATAYGAVVDAGLHRAPSIKVAEAAKVIENIQRDLNVALMNELAMVFHRLNVRTRDVLDAASSKWNFLPFEPGLVGGHCIGVDPYYMTSLAESLGYHPDVILAGRRINEGMSAFVAQQVVQNLALTDVSIRRARVGLLGLTFKPNVNDLRNSKVPDIISELQRFGIDPLAFDPLVEQDRVKREYPHVRSVPFSEFEELDALVLAVPHDGLLAIPIDDLCRTLKHGGTLLDVKSALDPKRLRDDLRYWSL
jgi:UDP-N-acetyl-D-galactosamine dehydrogenase